MKTHRYIAVEGVIGVGKTNLAGILSSHLEARLILEEVDDNPFLAPFYEDRYKYAFQTQIFFLLNRFRQLSEMNQPDLFDSVVVSDYHFAKDRIFAYLNLNDQELAMYERVTTLLEERLPTPDLVVFLQASTDVLLERIQDRGRDYERHIEASYLKELAEAYNHFFFHQVDCPIVVVNANNLDLAEDNVNTKRLIEVIKQPHFGIEYYNPEE